MEITSRSSVFLSIYIIYILAFHQVLSQDLVSSPRAGGRSCRSFFNRPATCVDILQCDSFLKLLREEPFTATSLISRSRCSVDGDASFLVCCPGAGRSHDDNPGFVEGESTHGRPHSSRRTKCGYSSAHHDRVVGGNPAELGAWPWIAVLGYGSKPSSNIQFRCGGTLISSRYVVTAAHCILSSLRIVRLGEQNLVSDNDGAHPIDIPVDKKIVHPQYNAEKSENDIALLRLSEPVKFTDAIHPICLPTSKDLRSRNFVGYYPFIAGWGTTSFKGAPSAVLMEAQVPVISNAKCKEDYRRVENAVIDNRILCAGYSQGGKDACQGDSGGPLMLPVKNVFYLIGVISGGYKCAAPGYPGLYTRVTSFLNFISKNTK